MEAHLNWLIRPSKTIDRSTMFGESEVKFHTQVLRMGVTSCIVRQNVIAQTSLTKIINYSNLVRAYITKCNIYSTQCDLFDIRRSKFNCFFHTKIVLYYKVYNKNLAVRKCLLKCKFHTIFEYFRQVCIVWGLLVAQ